MRVVVIAKKYYYEDRTHKQHSVFEWDTQKHPKLSKAVKPAPDDAEVGEPKQKTQQPTTLSQVAKGAKPNVSSPSKKK